MRSPRGLAAPNSSLRSLLPSTAKARGAFGSSGGRNSPSATRKDNASVSWSPAPLTIVWRSRPPPSTEAVPWTRGTIDRT